MFSVHALRMRASSDFVRTSFKSSLNKKGPKVFVAKVNSIPSGLI